MCKHILTMSLNIFYNIYYSINRRVYFRTYCFGTYICMCVLIKSINQIEIFIVNVVKNVFDLARIKIYYTDTFFLQTNK